VLSLFLGSKYGLFGIFLATIIARLLTNVWYDPYVIYKYGLHKNPFIYLKRYLYFFITIIISTLITYFLLRWFIVSNIYINFIIHFFIVLIIPNLVFVLMIFKFSEFKYVKNLIDSILKKC